MWVGDEDEDEEKEEESNSTRSPDPSMIKSILTLLLAFTVPAFAADRYEKRAEHDRDGIGVFYMGREIAHVMGHLGADWLERPERQQEERTDLLIDALKLKPGDVVADIGAGTGYIAEKMARRILPGGV